MSAPLPSPVYAVVMAGGSGVRLWPASRADHPKQLLALGGERPLIAEALERVADALNEPTPYAHRFVVAGRAHEEKLRQACPQLPPTHLIIEPCARNTAPCVALAALHLKQRNPHAVMIVSPSDHHISYAGAFSEALKRAIKGAEQGKLVTLGIKPTRPETGFGYLERGAQVSDQEHPLEGAEGGRIEPRCEVRRFVEKPSREVAERYLASGDFLWNSGLFVMSVERLLSEVARQLPELWAALEAIEPTIGTPEYEPVLAERFAALRSVSLDYGVMEGAEGVEVVPVELGWSDVGHWAALRELYPQDTEGNVKVGASHLTLEARDNVIYSERPVALLGVTGLVVAESNGALLICPAERSQEVRDVVEALKAQGQGELT